MGVDMMSPARRSLLVQVFQQMDNTGNGSISIAEYRSAVAGETMRAFFEYIDAQGVADGELTLGDMITHVGGAPVRQVEDLLSAIEERQPGEAVELRVLRRCDPRRAETVPARLVSRDDLRKQATSTAPARFDRDPIRSIFRR